MKKLYTNVTLILPGEVLEGASILVEDGRIKTFGRAEAPADCQVEDLGGKMMTPGFIDLHVHGGAGIDFMQNDPDGVLAAARAHLEHGTTTLLPTSCASTNEALFDMFDGYRKADARNTEGARLYGIHLEGPYLSVKMKGAMEEHLLTDALPEYYMPILEAGGDIISRWTIAPERKGAFELAALLQKRGIVASAGHTTASPEILAEAAKHGFTLATHLYNAMTAMHKEGIFRLSGAAEGMLSNEAYDVEVVADGIHQPLEILNIAWRVKGSDRMALITDGTAVSGCPVPESGKSILASREVWIEDGIAKLLDRSAIAGSIATGDVLLKKGLAAGIPLVDVVKMLTATPARIIGATDFGRIQEGYLADLCVWDENNDVTLVLKEGREVYRK